MPLSAKSRTRFFVATSLLVLINCIFSVSGSAQVVPCKVTLNSLPAAPELQGFHLGMTTEQAKSNVPQIVYAPADALGSIKTTVNPSFDPRADKSRFQDVRSISLEFLDGHLVSLWIGYDSNFKWTNVADFVSGISQSLALPNAWTEWKVRGRQMRCADFELTVSTVAQSPSFRIVDSAAEATLAARRTAAAEEADAAEAAEVDEATDSEEIVADRKTKTYYPTGCRPGSSIAEPNRVTFKTTAEAEKAGYTPSRACS